MSSRCKGCNVSFKRSGLYPHFQLSRNPECQLYRLELDGRELWHNDDEDGMATSRAQEDVAKASHSNDEMDSTINGYRHLQQSTEEDGHTIKFFDQYERREVPANRSLKCDQDTEISEEDEDEQGAVLDGDDDDVKDDAWFIDEGRPEPPRLPVNLETRLDPNQEAESPEKRQVFRLRGGFEEALKNEPAVVKFPGLAGYSRVANEDVEMRDAAADTHNNPFTPFTSKLEWEVAKWAKLRGPGSTACSELLGIEGVSDLFVDRSRAASRDCFLGR